MCVKVNLAKMDGKSPSGPWGEDDTYMTEKITTVNKPLFALSPYLFHPQLSCPLRIDQEENG